MAIFGRETETIFELIHVARQEIETAAEALYNELGQDQAQQNRTYQVGLRKALFASPDQEDDNVRDMVEDFSRRIEQLCRPIVDREFGSISKVGNDGPRA
jgi:hypothetical protein